MIRVASKQRKKGQEVLSVVLISGILIGVVGSVYFWGVPLIQKNKDISTLENAEDFVRSLNSKIKNIANSGGRDQILVNIPGLLVFDGSEFILTVDTEGIIYAAGTEIPLGRNPCASSFVGTFGVHDPDTLCVKSTKLSEQSYRTTYALRYITLRSSDIQRDFVITLSGSLKSGSTDSTVVIDNKGSTSAIDSSTGRTVIRTLIEINIV